MSSTRQLAAIMFTDIVGYTAMMGEDEKKAFQILYKNRQIQQPIIKEFNGTWIKEIGDGVLASFYTVTDAVLCAAKIQKACMDLPDLNLRIGIHLGEVLFEDNDVFGDGVNIASRIQALAPSGAVWISEAVNKIVGNKKEFKTRFVREEILKNVKDAVQIYEVDTENIIVEDINISETPARLNRKIPEKSIAVLPFVNMSNDPDQEYFSDGVTEEIINSLAHLKDLKVAGRMSSFQFKGANSDLRIIGEKLGVSTVMEGSIRKQGNKLRITVQLINVQDGFHIWSEKYDRTMEDIFAIQDEIALAITEQLEITLLQKDRDLITKSHTQNPEAYEMFLKGRFHVIRRGASILTGIKHFQNAIELDPDFALAYAGYADASILLATYGLVPPKQVMILSKQLADKAVQLDPTLCEPYCTLGYYYTCYEWKWPVAKKNFLKSIKLNPRYAEVLLRYGCNYLSWVEGKFDEGEKHGKKAIKVEPLHSVCYGTHSLILHTGGKFREALDVCKMGIELDANSFLCRLNEGNIYMALEQYEDAISSYESAMKISNRHHFAVNGLIWTYCIIGKFDEARELMNELKERSLKEYITSTFTGISAAYLGNLDEAFTYLERAYNDREPVLLGIKHAHWVPTTIRNDPRFKHLLHSIGFPE